MQQGIHKSISARLDALGVLRHVIIRDVISRVWHLVSGVQSLCVDITGWLWRFSLSLSLGAMQPVILGAIWFMTTTFSLDVFGAYCWCGLLRHLMFFTVYSNEMLSIQFNNKVISKIKGKYRRSTWKKISDKHWKICSHNGLMYSHYDTNGGVLYFQAQKAKWSDFKKLNLSEILLNSQKLLPLATAIAPGSAWTWQTM